MNARVILPAIAAVALVIALIAILGKSSDGENSLPEQASILIGDPIIEETRFPPGKLVHAALLFRHTVRAPRQFPTSDPLLRPELFPRGIERSTRKGLEAARNASLLWKEWYKDFLTGDPDEVFARSSQADRCHETLAMVLHSWYPSPDDLPLSQVAIRMPPRGTDKYVENCGTMAYITRDYDPLHPIPSEIAKEEGFHTVGQYIDFLKNMTGEYNQSVNYFYMAYMEGFVSIDFENRFTADDHWMLKYTRTREFCRLYLLQNSINVVGPYYAHYLFNGIADQLQQAAEGRSKFRLSLFSFHDLNLLSGLRALGIQDKQTEPLAVMAFELRKHSFPGKKPDQFRVTLRLSQGYTTSWLYQPDEYVTIKTGDGHKVEELGEVIELMRTYYANQINITNCGYFGADAKI